MELRSVITMANSIIGVSVLAMPFCFKQCGVILATLIILLSGCLVKMTCHLLLKSALLTRRRNYEVLAFHIFGAPGKLAVEVSMIGFMFGTCVAFFVVIGDLAPPIVANMISSDSGPDSSILRVAIQIGLGLFLILPLTLLRDLQSLATICAASLLFYGGVMLHIIIAALPKIADTSWPASIIWWRPTGAIQCFPIICMALSCQPQVFEVYESLPDPSQSRMNQVVSGAVNLCSGVYILVGLFGYLACSNIQFGGNILTAFPTTFLTESIQLGFVLSVALSFPLVIFPCRTSIHSLLFRKGNSLSEIVTNYIPPVRFNVITLVVVTLSLLLGILIKDIELVLGIVGSTIGNVICIIFPSIFFIKVSSKDTTERLAAKAILLLGLLLMVLGTYVNLNAMDVRPSQQLQIDTPLPVELHEALKMGPAAPDQQDPARQQQLEVDPSRQDQLLPQIKEAGMGEQAARLIEELEKQKAEQKEILEQQKAILHEMRKHADEDRQEQNVHEVQPGAAAELQQSGQISPNLSIGGDARLKVASASVDSLHLVKVPSSAKGPGSMVIASKADGQQVTTVSTSSGRPAQAEVQFKPEGGGAPLAPEGL